LLHEAAPLPALSKRAAGRSVLVSKQTAVSSEETPADAWPDAEAYLLCHSLRRSRHRDRRDAR